MSFAIVGGKKVAPETAAALGRIPWWCLQTLKKYITQGVGDAPASKGTHLSGHAIDIRTRGLSDGWIYAMVIHLQSVGFAAVLRLSGEAGPTEHIHAALLGYSNSRAVAPLTRPGAKNHIDRKLNERRGA